MAKKKKSIEEYFDMGLSLMQDKKYSDAITAFKTVVELDPDYPKVRFHMGFCYDNLYDSENAEDCYQKAIADDPQDYEAYYNLGNKYLDISDPFIDDEEYGDYPKAIDYYEKALAIKPDFSFAWNNMGFCYSKMEQHQKALECHLKAIKCDELNQNAWMNIANDYYFLDNHLRAIECYEKAIDLDPDDSMAWICLRTTVESYKSKHPLDEHNKEMWIRITEVYLFLGKYEKAILCCKQLIKLDKSFFKAWHQLGEAYHLLQDHHQFITYFASPLKIIKKVKRISIVTTSAGPVYPDVFWLLETDTEISIVPSEGIDEDFLPGIQDLPGFDNAMVIKAMTSTEDAIFVCWEK